MCYELAGMCTILIKVNWRCNVQHFWAAEVPASQAGPIYVMKCESVMKKRSHLYSNFLANCWWVNQWLNQPIKCFCCESTLLRAIRCHNEASEYSPINLSPRPLQQNNHTQKTDLQQKQRNPQTKTVSINAKKSH